MLETTKQDKEIPKWIETSICMANMLTALDNGVKGGKWFSLIYRLYLNTYFAELGLFTAHKAWVLACQSR